MHLVSRSAVLIVALCLNGCAETPAPDPNGRINDSGGFFPDGGATFDATPNPDALVASDSDRASDALVADAPPPAAQSGEWVLIEGPQPFAESSSVTPLSAPGEGPTRVLIAGGRNRRPDQARGYIQEKLALRDAWIYDMGSRSFELAGTMAVARYGHTATRLADGRVLVVGGYGQSDQPLASTEIFDPARPPESAWIEGPPLIGGPRVGHAAVPLEDGKVFVIGSLRSGFEDSLEAFSILDPTLEPNGRWESLAEPLREKREFPAAVRLASGSILVVGGGGEGNEVDTVELFDPDQGQFHVLGEADSDQEETERLSVWKGTPTLTPFRDRAGKEKVLVVGGRFSPEAKDEIIDPGFEVIRAINHPFGAPVRHAATLLKDGRVLVCGGDQGKTDRWLAFVFDPRSVSPTWNALPSLRIGRSDHDAVTMRDGTVLVVGGTTGGAAVVERAELFVPGAAPPIETPTPDVTWHQLDIVADEPDLRSVWGTAPNNLWVGVNSGWELYHWNGNKWTEHVLPDKLRGYSSDMVALHGNGARDIYALDDDARVWHFGGTNWELIRKATGGTGRDLWVSGKDVYLSTGGQIWHYRGERDADTGEPIWAEIYAGPDITVSSDSYALWGRGTELYAVGSTSLFLHYVGGKWEPRAFPSNQRISAIAGDDRAIYFAGTAGLAIRLVDGAFQALDSRISFDFSGLSVADGNAFAIDSRGYLFHHWGAETRWHELKLPPIVESHKFRGVWSKGNDVVLVGNDGRAYRGTLATQ